MRDKDLCRTLENIYRILRSIRLCWPIPDDHAGLIDREMLKLLETIEEMGGGIE